MLRPIVLSAALFGCSGTNEPEDQAAFPAGQAQRLSVRVESEVSGGDGLLSGPADKRYSLRGTAVLLPLSTGEDEARIRLQLDDLALQTTSASEQAALERLLPVLGEPAVFTLRNGSVEDLRVSPRMQVQAYGWLRAVVSALQWPQRVGAEAVEVEEEDATGRYKARVERTDSGLRKVKTRYVKLSSQGVGAGSAGVMPEVAHSEHTRSPAHGPLSRVTVDETLQVPLSDGKQLEVTTRLRLSARKAQKNVLTAQELEDVERELTGLAVFSPPAPREGAFDAARIRGATLDQVLSESSPTPGSATAYASRRSSRPASG